MTKNELTRKEFEALLTKSAQPLPKPEQPPDQEREQTSGQPTSDDCVVNHKKHPNKRGIG